MGKTMAAQSLILTSYTVRPGDSFVNVSDKIYSGQAWEADGEKSIFITGNDVPINLVCGCIGESSQLVATYTVQDKDTLSIIADLFSTDIGEIEKLNPQMTQKKGFLDIGWVLFVPIDKNGIPACARTHKEIHLIHHQASLRNRFYFDIQQNFNALCCSGRRRNKWKLIIAILSVAMLLSAAAFLMILLKRRTNQQPDEEDPKAVSKRLGPQKTASLRKKYDIEDVTAFESERPVVYSLDEIEDATMSFDETRKIGEAGYGCVYHGVHGEQEVAIKKMKSNKSKEFFAELKVLCKIHHINVVELLGYASGDDHLYLVYEYVKNGSLAEHLHDPLLKGHQPLSWTARAQIAVDAARGIKYIHDYTKARHVHRDIKTSNILLDKGLRAKVADFGLVKLVERAGEGDIQATRLVGTPGYLPPESVFELQTTSKSDVFAFGVVVAELITGQRALIRNNQEPQKMKSLISVVTPILFRDKDSKIALEAIIDGNLRSCFPMEEVYQMAEIAEWCLETDRPEMQEIVVILSKIQMASVKWEATLGGNSTVFSGLFEGR
ncbi:lysM domain receptor-like kinase 3 [Papaver somniferum]|uniref:lysM domain receptor-like kinase 3 n=1 Tax=Papaver somniferum TaxID=3469 RepID=UPI000E6FAC7D|nr:lysM domain receptor-like kinase 3 [Papaver somniferum]